MDKPESTGINIRQQALLNYCRAASRARQHEAPDDAFAVDRAADEIEARHKAGEPNAPGDFSFAFNRYLDAEFLRRVYIKLGGKPSLDFRFNRDAKVLLTSANLSKAERKMVLARCSPPLIWFTRNKWQNPLIHLEAPPNFSRKPIDPKKLETIEFHAVWDEDAPSD